MANRPFDTLNAAIGKEVLLMLKGGIRVRGTLKAFDVHMNIVLDNAEEIKEENTAAKYGVLMVRGDSIVMINP
jgi:small nuclear ribonucleoprotein (snRNP)-like protein